MYPTIKKWLCCAFTATVCTLLQGASIWINEFHYDNTSYDSGEFIEIAGTAGSSLDDHLIALYNGSNGSVYRTVELSGILPNQSNGYGTLAFQLPTNGIQNGGPDGIALGGLTGSLIQFISYEGSFTASGGIADGISSVDILQDESNNTPLGYSLQLVGTGSKSSDFTWTAPSPHTAGKPNEGQSFAVTSSASTALLLLASLSVLGLSRIRRQRTT